MSRMLLNTVSYTHLGKITVVYKLGEQFEQSEALYLYDLLGNTEAQEVILSLIHI